MKRIGREKVEEEVAIKHSTLVFVPHSSASPDVLRCVHLACMDTIVLPPLTLCIFVFGRKKNANETKRNREKAREEKKMVCANGIGVRLVDTTGLSELD